MPQGILGAEKGNEVLWTATSNDHPEVREVYLGFAHFASYRRDDLKARNILVGLMGGTSIRRQTIAEAFEVNRCLVGRYTKDMQAGGAEALVRDERGRKPKVTPAIAEYVRREFRKIYATRRKRFVGTLIAKVESNFGVTVSSELIRQITKPVRDEMAKGDAAKQKATMLPVLYEKPSPPVAYDGFGKNGTALLRRLEVGFYSRYAGGLLLNVFIAKLTEGVFEEDGSPREHYDLKTFVLMVMHMVNFDIVNIERVKRLYRKEFGLLVGKDKSPILGTMRRKLGELVGRVDTDKALTKLARNYIDNLAPESRTFYVDDHFDPYWGKQEVLKGFSHVYDRPMEGTEHCFVHDAAGNPLFFGLRDCFSSFNQVLPHVAARLKALVGADERISLVFDRGGYDKKVFNQLGRMNIRYAVWAKGDKIDYQRLNLPYEEEEFLFRGNTPDTPRRVRMGIAEMPCEQGGRGGPKRKIVLRREAGRRLRKRQTYMYSAFVTNDEDKTRHVLTEEIILRWRQECDFKSESGEFGIDQITTYLMKSYREGAAEDIREIPREEVEGKQARNPALKPLQHRKRQIKRDISKIDQELGKRTFGEYEADLRTVAEVSLTRGNSQLLRQRKKFLSALAEVEKEMRGIPKTLNFLDLLKEREVVRFDFRKKLFMDTLKVAARNVRRMALGVLARRYDNYRDQVEFLRRLIRSGGHVKLGRDGTMVVTLSAMNADWENQAAKTFLSDINSLHPVLLGGTPIALEFRLAR